MLFRFQTIVAVWATGVDPVNVQCYRSETDTDPTPMAAKVARYYVGKHRETSKWTFAVLTGSITELSCKASNPETGESWMTLNV